MELTIPLAALAVGIVYGLFGVGSAFATPVLSLVGVHGLVAVVAPLPALIPSSAAGAWTYARAGQVDRALVARVVVAALPAAVVGSLLSRQVGGPVLLVLSGLVLLVVGTRILLPGTPVDPARSARLRADARVVATAAVSVGLLSGLLANGGGFLLVPLFLLVLGLDMHEATGTSLLIATALSVPTLVTHLVLGDIDWTVAAAVSAGLVPGAVLGGQLSRRLPTARLRTGFGALLVVFALWYLLRQLRGG